MSDQHQAGREQLASRLGFILLSAGCAIGLGNVWRFPYICGQYGGAIFLLIYLLFLVILGYPVMVMELAVGRAGRSDLIGCYRNLKAPGTKLPWVAWGKLAFTGNLVLLMFYSVVTGWLLSYAYSFLTGEMSSLSTHQEVGQFFTDLLQNPGRLVLFAYIAIGITFVICFAGLRKGVERVTKIMMLGLFVLMILLAIQACCLPNAEKGLEFLLKPNMATMEKNGIWAGIHAAMAQAFFTLSLGIGSLAIFGSYIGRERSLSSEASCIIALDTFVAICAGFIIFPSCFAFDVQPDSGPSLIFITLPKIFLDMEYGNVRGFVFFLFLSIAALTTLIAVAENLIAFSLDRLHLSRRKATILVGIVLLITSLPCAFGFNYWSHIQPLGKGSSILDLEDFIVSANLLPLGSLMLVLFCTHSKGWGWKNFLNEANEGQGYKFPAFLRIYITWILPVLIFGLWLIGILQQFKIL